jgi:putative exosortase-associated protein (TIGR04073 family)
MKTFRTVSISLAFLCLPALSWADLRLPPKPTMMEKLARGIGNVTLSVSELFDSPYMATQRGGATYGDTLGFTQGVSRMVMDVGVGTLEIGTFFIPTKSMKMPAHDTGQVNPLPPADLKDNWY